MVTIAVDIMGGDNAPEEIIKGALNAAQANPEWQIILVGKADVVKSFGALPANVRLEAAASVMAMDESVENLRQKQDSSIWVATELVKSGQADAIVSAGSTGAQMASALLLLGRIKGIDRPGIGVAFPTLRGSKIIVDVGANADCKPEQLLQFGLMGNAYSEVVFQTKSPRIALFANGTEEHKGNELTVKAHQLLKNSSLNFIGNREGRDVPYGDFDVLVCDGFTGNALIKMAEGVSAVMFDLLKDAFTKNLRSKVGALCLMPSLKDLKSMFDYDAIGGAPLLGVKGVSIVCHGSSKALAIENAVRVANDCVAGQFIAKITQAAQNLQNPSANAPETAPETEIMQ